MSEDPPAPVVATRRRLWHTAVTSISQGASFLGVAALGLLIAAKFGSSPVTDGFFIAQSSYSIALLMGQSLRTTAVAGLSHRENGVSETLVAVGLIAGVVLVAFAACAWLLIPEVTSSLPPRGTEMARLSLALLGPAAMLQLLGGALAAVLAARDRVAVSAIAFGLSSAVGLAVFLPLLALVGDVALPLVLVLMSLASFGVLLGAVIRSGGIEWRRPERRAALHRATQLTIGSVSLLVGQLVVAVTVTLASQVGPSGSTTYSYSSMALNLVVATVVSPAMLMLAPVLAREWAGDDRSLAALAGRVFRLGAVLLVPAMAGVVLVGVPVLELLFAETGRATVSDISTAVLALSPVAVATLIVLVPELGLITRHRFGVLARIAVGVLLIHVCAGISVVHLGGDVTALALASSATSLISALAVVWVGAGSARRAIYAATVAGTVRLVVIPALVYVAAAQFLQPGRDLVLGGVAWIVGSIVAAGWIFLVQRRELFELASIARRARPPALAAEEPLRGSKA